MVEERGGFGAITEAVRFHRKIKGEARAERRYISTSGSRRAKNAEAKQMSETILEYLDKRHATYIEEKQQLVRDYLSPVEASRAEEIYKAGLVLTITQADRLSQRFPGAVKLNDPNDLRKLIIGYTFDFYQSIRASESLGIPPTTALKIAKLSYLHNPNKRAQLASEYHEVRPNIINQIMLSHPTNPEGPLNEYKATIERQKQKGIFRRPRKNRVAENKEEIRQRAEAEETARLIFSVGKSLPQESEPQQPIQPTQGRERLDPTLTATSTFESVSQNRPY